MSLVMSLVMHNKAVITGDLRATNVDNTTDKMNGVTKVFKLNESVSYGLTGDLTVSYEVRTFLAKQAPGKGKSELNVQQTARLIRRFLRGKLKNNPDMQQRVQVIGLGDGGKITLIELNHDDDYKLRITAPDEQQACWASMHANVAPDINAGFEGLPDYGVNTIAEMLAKVNSDVSEVDDFVSEGCVAITITI